MAGQKNPFDQFDNAPRVIVTKPADPKLPYEGPRAASEAAIAAAQAQHAGAIQAADARIKNAQAAEIERKNAELAAEDAATKIRPTGKLTLDQVPSSARPIVSAMLAGNLPVGARSVTSPQMLPYLQMAVNIDPNFSAATFPARAAAMKQLADMKSTGGYLTSLAANIDHSKEEEAAIQRLNNPSGLYGRFGGASLHNWIVNKGGPAGAQFDQANRVYSGEQVKSIVGNVGSAGGGSALADRQDAERAISASMPIDAQRAALRVGAMQNYQKYRDADQGFMRTMGTHIPSPLSQEQAAQLLHLMRLQEDGTEGPVPKEVDPAFVALAQGNSAPPGAGGPPGMAPPSGPTPPAGGTPPGNPPAGPTGSTSYYGNNGGPSGGLNLASGATTAVPDPTKQAAIAQLGKMFQGGAPDDRIMAFASILQANPASVAAALDFRRKNPNYHGAYNLDSLGFKDVPVSMIGQGLNAVAQSPAGALGINAANAVTGNNLDSIIGMTGGNADLARAGMQGVTNANPISSAAGNLAGGALAAGGLELGMGGAAARLGLGAAKVGEAATEASPWIARGADALYGGISGAGNADDGNRLGAGLLGTVAGVGGGMFGRATTRAVGGALKGVTDPSTTFLSKNGVPLTIGQASGGIAKSVEDRLAGLPFVGDAINARRTAGLKGFNAAALNETLSPIGTTAAGNVGEQGIQTAQGAVGDAYTNALSGVHVNADAPFVADMRPLMQQAKGLPAPMGDNALYTLNTRVGNSFDPNGGLSGNDFQQSLRGLNQDAAAVRSQPYGNDFGQITGGARDALTGMLDRQAPGVMPAFNSANEAYKRLQIAQDAVRAAKNTDGIFTPAQLNQASVANTVQFGGKGLASTEDRPFFELGRAGQQVLPNKIPDSGTAGRAVLAHGLGITGLAGTGAGLSYAGGGDPQAGAETGIGAAALGSLLYSKTGQKLLVGALLNRPDIARLLGKQVQSAAPIGGMFGAGAAPQFLPPQ